MPSEPEFYYLTAEEWLVQTLVPTDLIPSTEEEVSFLLLETMAEIDAYIGEGWARFDPGQEFIFPRCTDVTDAGDAEIPRAVSLATRMIADAILLKRSKSVLPHEVVSESNLGHSYTKRQQTLEAELGFEHWPQRAFGLLAKYKQAGGSFGVVDDCCGTL